MKLGQITIFTQFTTHNVTYTQNNYINTDNWENVLLKQMVFHYKNAEKDMNWWTETFL